MPPFGELRHIYDQYDWTTTNQTIQSLLDHGDNPEPPTTTDHQVTSAGDDMILFYCRLGQARPRAAIMMHRSMKDLCWEIGHLTSPDSVAIKVTLGSSSFVLASVYMDFTQPISPTIFNELSSMAN